MAVANEATRAALAPCPLGWLIVAATDRGVCTIRMGDDPAALRAGLGSRHRIVDGLDDELAGWVTEVVALTESPGSPCRVPLDVWGTDFQVRVWEALRAIPPGETATYAEIAARIGAPAAVRAVGTACGANPVAPVVPCHRVVRTDGGLGGYAYGLAVKEWLLDHERRHTRSA